MEFFNSFVPVYIKYDFTSEIYGTNVAKDWIECRLNVKPAPNSYRNVQITVYPKYYDEMMPHFTIDIDYANIRCGAVKSHSKKNTVGVLWCSKSNKKCRLFIAFDNKTMHQNFSKYFRKLLKFFNLYNNCENDEHKVSNKNVNSSVSNDAEQMIATTSQADASSVQIMRVSDESGSYEDVVLRPKPADPNRRLARSLAAISNLFKSNRESGSNQQENTDNSAKVSATGEFKSDQKKPKKKNTWNIFKLKKKNRNTVPSFQHFQEPLDVERLSLSIGGGVNTYNDVEWYDLNKEEMSMFEARLSDIVNEFNNYNQITGESESESIDRNDVGRYLTISSNILWSHNLSVSCQSSDNTSNINLLGANINREQIHSDVYIEDGGALAQSSSCTEAATAANELNASFLSTDSHGYAVMQPILSKKSIEPTILIDDITKSLNLHCNYSSDDSCNLSSGFGSDSDANTPQKSLAFANSPATSDFSEAFPMSGQSNECTPTTPLHTKNMQKTTKKRRLQIKSRKLFGMLYVKHTPSPVNVTPTPQNKSPIECQEKKLYKGTPLKLRISKQTNDRETENQRPFHLRI